jgi:hypothetical protein
MTEEEWTVLECPECESKRGAVIAGGERAKCVDCGKVYPIKTIPDSEAAPNPKKPRTAAPGTRHRRDNGPQELLVKPVQPPEPKDIGTLSRYTHEIIQGGPRALIAAQHKAAGLSEKFGEEFEAQWCLCTPWLQSLLDTPDTPEPGQSVPPRRHDLKTEKDMRLRENRADRKYNVGGRNRARARYALAWRPRFLAYLALSGGQVLAARAARVSMTTVHAHRRADKDFDAQCIAAQENAFELLHDVTMKSAIEGECEPIYWQRIQVGHVKKVDNRLRIEMLRAHMPKVFKTPGTKVAIQTGGGSQNLFVCGPEEIEQLQSLRREALERMKEKQALPSGT